MTPTSTTNAAASTRWNGSLKVVGAACSLLVAAVMMFLSVASFVRAEIAEHASSPGHQSVVTREAFQEFRSNVYRRLDRIETLIQKHYDHPDRPAGR